MAEKNKKFIVILLLIALGIYLYYTYGSTTKQVPTDINFGDNTSSAGTLGIRVRTTDGQVYDLPNDFYKVSGFSILTGATTATCTPGTPDPCVTRCKSNGGATAFCDNNVRCQSSNSKCVVYGLSEMGFTAGVANTGSYPLRVYLHSAASTQTDGTVISPDVFASSWGALEKYVDIPLRGKGTFAGSLFSMSPYESLPSQPIIFKIEAYATFGISGRYPVLGGTYVPSSVRVSISPDVTGGAFTLSMPEVSYSTCGDSATADTTIGEICECGTDGICGSGGTVLDTFAPAKDCTSFGYNTGTLYCGKDCKSYDTSACTSTGIAFRSLTQTIDNSNDGIVDNIAIQMGSCSSSGGLLSRGGYGGTATGRGNSVGQTCDDIFSGIDTDYTGTKDSARKIMDLKTNAIILKTAYISAFPLEIWQSLEDPQVIILCGYTDNAGFKGRPIWASFKLGQAEEASLPITAITSGAAWTSRESTC